MTKTNSVKPAGIKYILAAAGGSGKSTLGMLMASTALHKLQKIDIFCADPANPTARRYFKWMPPQNRLDDDRPDALLRYFETVVFGSDSPAIVDLGANMEGTVLRWLADRGAAAASEIRFIVPVSKRDGIKAAGRIALNSGATPVLLVMNEAGLDWEATAADPAFKSLAAKVGRLTTLPALGPTMQDVHSSSTPPHVMVKSEHRFESQGALNMMRKIEDAFLDYPDFRPW